MLLKIFSDFPINDNGFPPSGMWAFWMMDEIKKRRIYLFFPLAFPSA